MKQANEVTINFKLSPEMKRQLEKKCGDLDLTVSALMRRLVRNLLNGQTRQDQPANTVGGSGEQQHKRAA